MTHQDILRDFPLAVELIKAEEGFRATPYKCTSGAWTIGYGTNLDARHISPDGLVWSKAKAQEETLDELEILIAELDRRWPSWRNLDDIRKAVILSSVYQLGIYGAAQFKATIAALLERDFNAAAVCLLRSKWARQTPARVKRNADAIRTGKLPEVVNGVKIFPSTTDGELDQTPEQSPAPLLPAEGPGLADAQGPLVLPPLRDTAPAASLTGFRLSKKLCVVIAGAAVLLLNEPLHFGLTPQDTADMVKLLAAYLVGQSGVDAFKPFAAAIIKAGAK